MNEEEEILEDLASRVNSKKSFRELHRLDYMPDEETSTTITIQSPVWIEDAQNDKSQSSNSSFKKIDWLKEKKSRRLMVNRLFSSGTIRRIL